MAEIPNKVKNIIDQFLKELAKNNIGIEQAILFGSYAQGTFNDWSDIDLAIVSKAFEGERFKDRDKIRRIKLKVSCDLEPIPYKPEEFNIDNPFVKRILETGIKIA
ncbi:nucleotidyltransferase domain-containing protein [Thermodesulfovibrionales bacterium]|nr:nucleotidyltransferase domain-containing protein [Thermodesulfovibrionales bacterium]MCL0035635.1 nucleotidyltransferase domain-containing protein [Thermodesulfovibrionales bacterium]MCL0050103.1 nucleotidyltransferase domain-containing protein [Thermodesulfovibrionales bacterium]MCL0107247.1 nucleotidyltransferase domain-containing protein [Thermodesulfovibrionales bacterium]